MNHLQKETDPHTPFSRQSATKPWLSVRVTILFQLFKTI